MNKRIHNFSRCIALLCSVIVAVIVLPQQAIAQKVNRVACLGDSITEGTPGNACPAILQQLLGASYEVRNFGVGATTLLQSGAKPYVRQPAFAEALSYRAQMVVIMLGTNDSKQDDWQHAASFQKDYVSLIAALRKQNPQVRIYLCTPPPVVVDAWGIRGQVVATEVCPKIAAVAKSHRLMDVHAAFVGKTGLHSDGVHPNAAGARLIAEQVHAALKAKPQTKSGR